MLHTSVVLSGKAWSYILNFIGFYPHRYGYSLHKTVAGKYYSKYISLISETKDVYMVGCISEYEYMYFKTTDNKIYCGERRLDSDEYFMYANEYLNVYSKEVFKVRPGNYEVKINEIFNELNKKKNEISNSGEYRAYRVTWNENDSFLFIQNWSQVCDRGSKTEWISILYNIIGK